MTKYNNKPGTFLVTSVKNFCYIKKLLDNSDDEPFLNLGQNSQSHLLKGG